MGMMTVRLDQSLEKRLETLSESLGMSKSDLVRDALKRQLALIAFEKHRETAMPFAEAQGVLTDEDVFREIS